MDRLESYVRDLRRQGTQVVHMSSITPVLDGDPFLLFLPFLDKFLRQVVNRRHMSFQSLSDQTPMSVVDPWSYFKSLKV